MSQQPSIEDFAKAISDLPAEYKARLQELTGLGNDVDTIDTVGIKTELVKFCAELRKHNQAIVWETNKQTPKKIDPEGIIEDARKLFAFIVE